MSLPWPDPNSISTFDMIQILRTVVFDKIPTSHRYDPYYGRLESLIRNRGDSIIVNDSYFFGYFDTLILGENWETRKADGLPVKWIDGTEYWCEESFWLKPNWSISDIGFASQYGSLTIDPASRALVKFSDLETMLGEPLVPSPTRCDKRLWLKWLRQRLRIIDYLQTAITSRKYPMTFGGDDAFRYFKREDDPPQKISGSYSGYGRTAYALYYDRIYTGFEQVFYVAGSELDTIQAFIENGGFSINGKVKIKQFGLVQKYNSSEAFDEFFYDFGLGLQENTFVRLGTAEVTADPASHVMIRELTEPQEWRTPYEGMSRKQACGFTAGEALNLFVYDFTENATYYGGI